MSGCLAVWLLAWLVVCYPLLPLFCPNVPSFCGLCLFLFIHCYSFLSYSFILCSLPSLLSVCISITFNASLTTIPPSNHSFIPHFPSLLSRFLLLLFPIFCLWSFLLLSIFLPILLILVSFMPVLTLSLLLLFFMHFYSEVAFSPPPPLPPPSPPSPYNTVSS